MTPAEQAQLVADCIATGGHFRRTVIYLGETAVRCHMCGCPRGWTPPARRLSSPTGVPVVAHGPTRLGTGPAEGRIRAMPLGLLGRPIVRDVQPCGTPAGYHRHRRDDQDPCEACRAAHSASSSAGARRRRALG
jgi:hypothetical protein